MSGHRTPHLKIKEVFDALQVKDVSGGCRTLGEGRMKPTP